MTTGPDIVSIVRGFLGDPYIYGAEGPNTFDCSGLTQYAYSKGGINIPRTSSEQWAFLNKTGNTTSDKSALFATPGDLIFSQWPGDDATPGHVGVYIGGHQLIEAPKPGGVVQVAHIDQDYFDHIYGVGHVPGVSLAGVTADSLTPGSNASYTADTSGSFAGATAQGSAQAQSGGGILGWLSGGPMEKALAGNPNPAGDPLGISGTLQSLAGDFQGLGKILYTLTLPSTWARVAAGLLGTLLLTFGLYRLGKDIATDDND